MAETDRTDLTEHDRGEPLTDTTTETKTETTTTRDGTPAQPAGTTAPLVPHPENEQVPAGIEPPGGAEGSTGDLLAKRRAAEQADREASTDERGTGGSVPPES